MRKPGKPQALEQLRMVAARLFELDKPIPEIMHVVERDDQTVRAWRRAWRQGGVEALKAKAHPGRVPKLSSEQWQEVLSMLQRSPREHGYDAYLWTTSLMARLIHEKLGIEFHHDYVGEMLHKLGWTCQRPTKRAKERNEQEIARWREQSWPDLLKKVVTMAP